MVFFLMLPPCLSRNITITKKYIQKNRLPFPGKTGVFYDSNRQLAGIGIPDALAPLALRHHFSVVLPLSGLFAHKLCHVLLQKSNIFTEGMEIVCKVCKGYSVPLVE